MGRTPVLPKRQFCQQLSAFPGSIPALFTLAPPPCTRGLRFTERGTDSEEGAVRLQSRLPQARGWSFMDTRMQAPRRFWSCVTLSTPAAAQPCPYLSYFNSIPLPGHLSLVCPWPTCTTASLSENIPSYKHLPKKRVAMKSQPSKRGNILHGLRKVCNLGNKSFRSAYHILADSGKRIFWTTVWGTKHIQQWQKGCLQLSFNWKWCFNFVKKRNYALGQTHVDYRENFQIQNELQICCLKPDKLL